MSAPCALWWLNHLSPCFAVCDDEDDAAGRAWGLEDNGLGAVLGVQFADGRLIRRDGWPLLEELSRRYEAAESAQRAKPAKKPPQRQIRDPFDSRPLSIDASEPGWLGIPLGT